LARRVRCTVGAGGACVRACRRSDGGRCAGPRDPRKGGRGRQHVDGIPRAAGKEDQGQPRDPHYQLSRQRRRQSQPPRREGVQVAAARLDPWENFYRKLCARHTHAHTHTHTHTHTTQATHAHTHACAHTHTTARTRATTRAHTCKDYQKHARNECASVAGWS
jgi:hypothetical protein